MVGDGGGWGEEEERAVREGEGGVESDGMREGEVGRRRAPRRTNRSEREKVKRTLKALGN